MKSIRNILFIFVLVFLLPFVFAYESDSLEGFSAQISYDWLEDQIGSDGSIDQDVRKTASAILALDAVGYDTTDSQDWLLSQLSTDYCYPSSSCTTTDTAFAVFALYEVQDDGNFESIEAWYQEALSDADVSGAWNLEVVSSATGSCVVSYELEEILQEIDVAVDGGVFTDCGNTHFLDLDACLQAGLISSYPGITIDVDCSDLEGNVVLTHLYSSSSTYYLLANENAAQAEFQINNGCFGKSAGSSCDVESTLYSDWALGKLGSSISTLVYLKENYDDSHVQRVALLYLVTKDTAYLTDLASLQKSDGSFDRDPYTTALAVLALSESSEYSSLVEDAKSYLREEQGSEGDWGADVQATAMVLYAAFGDEDVTPSNPSPGDGGSVVYECDTNADCEILYDSGYICDEGICSFSSSPDGCQTDDDCDDTDSIDEVCRDDACIASECNYKGNCEYPDFNENVYNCPSDCGCGDGVCDDVESDSSSYDEYYCAEDCGGEEESGGCSSDSECTPYSCDTSIGECENSCSSDDDCSAGYSCEDSSCRFEGSSSDSSWLFYIVLFLILVGVGVGGYFAYKKGLFDRILGKFRKGGGKPSFGFEQQSTYSPFTSKLPQQKPPFSGQPKRPF